MHCSVLTAKVLSPIYLVNTSCNIPRFPAGSCLRYCTYSQFVLAVCLSDIIMLQTGTLCSLTSFHMLTSQLLPTTTTTTTTTFCDCLTSEDKKAEFYRMDAIPVIPPSDKALTEKI